jgi:hypothetical protein
MLEEFVRCSKEIHSFRNIYNDGNINLRMKYEIKRDDYINLEIAFGKVMDGWDMETALKVFYEVDYYRHWIPSLGISKTVNFSNLVTLSWQIKEDYLSQTISSNYTR